MKNNKLTIALSVLGLFCVNLLLAQSTISGKVTDAETNEPIPGVNILIQGTSEGTNTDFDGNFMLSSNQAIPFTLQISSVGFSSQSVEVTSADQVINVSLQAGQNLDEIVVSASRKAQKVQDAPASVSIISAKDIENSAVAVDPVRHLQYIPGVQLQQQSANKINIEMRAGSGIFGTSAFPILDYRYLVTPSGGQFNSFQTGLSNIDIAKVEVVRGAASALYGPGVTSGVVHFMSKSPIDYPGTTVELLGGNMRTLGASIRHAFANEDKTFGYKINARYIEGNDFGLDNQEDADQIATFSRTIAQPDITPEGYVDVTSPGTILLNSADLDDDFDGNPLGRGYQNYSVNAHLQYRPNEETEAFLSGGLASGNGLFFNDQGAGMTQGTDYWVQGRVSSGGFFGALSYNYNDGGLEDNPTFLYASGFRQVARRAAFEAQLQYNFDLPEFLDTSFTIGGDYRDIYSDSANTLYGRYDANDDYIIAGAYIQGTSRLSDQLELTYALRYDDFNIFDEGLLAPRAALVYKLNDKNTLRASFNRATSGPVALQQFIDFPLAILAPGVLDVWLAGQADPHVFSANPTIDLALTPGIEDNLPFAANALPAAYLYGGLMTNPAFQQLLGTLPDVLVANGVPAASAPALAGIVNGFLGSGYVPTASVGSFYKYNLFTGEPMNEVEGTPGSLPGYTNSFEIGYSGLLFDKLKVGVDFYTYEVQGFTQFSAIGPTIGLLEAGGDPRLLGTAASLDGIPAEFGGIIGGDFATYAVSNGLLDAATAGLLGGVLGQYFGGGAQNLIAVTGPAAFAALGAVESDRVPQNDGIVHIPAGYRRFEDAKRSHYGIDVDLEYFANENYSFFANGSWLSQTEWAIGDDDLPFTSFLNAPQTKARAGVRYADDNFRWSVTYQYDEEFYANVGQFAGIAPEKNLIDANIGYTTANGVRFDLTASNLFDRKYRAFANMPIIGRQVIGKITFDL
ncbi:MAG: TonB-dependent receptor domain-containing protein [Flavobacteriaceae bacterium]